MIDEVDRLLVEWVGSVLKGTPVSLAAPNGEVKGTGIYLYLMQLAEMPPARGGRKRPPLQMSLRYLVSASAEDPEEAHRLLGELVFAAMEREDTEVDFDPVLPAVWTAFGTAPRPSFTLRVPLRRERRQPEVALVRSGVAVQSTAAISIHGIVLGPGGVPLMNARVECPALNLVSQTDHHGRFRFSAVPATPPPEFRATAKGKVLLVRADSRSLGGDPLVIQFDKLE